MDGPGGIAPAPTAGRTPELDDLGPSSGLAVRALGSLYQGGAVIGLVSLLLPHSGRADDAGLYSNVGIALAGGITILALASRLPRWSLHIWLAAGTILITRAVLLSADPVSFYSVWFIW